MSKREVEERSVTKSELASGVALKAGHAVLLLVTGVRARDRAGARDAIEVAATGSASGAGTTESNSASASDSGGGSDEGAPAAAGGADGTASGDSTRSLSQAFGTGTAADAGNGSTTVEVTPPDQPTPSERVVLDAAHFETNKAFPLPSALPAFRAIARLSSKDPSRPLLVLGHTDAIGTAEQNLGLSEVRRRWSPT